MWFISHTINTHFFHENIWTHNWPAPNVSGFIAQLVEHRSGIARSRVQTLLKSWFFFQASLRNCINCIQCDNHFFIFIIILLLRYSRKYPYFPIEDFLSSPTPSLEIPVLICTSVEKFGTLRTTCLNFSHS